MRLPRIMPLIVLFFLVLVGAAYLSSRFGPSQKTGIVPTPTPSTVVEITPPRFSQLETVAGKPAHDTSGLVGDFPAQITAYRVLSSPAILDSVRQITRSLGFVSPPQTIDIPGGPLLAWVEGEKTFSVGGDPPVVAYHAGLPKDLSVIAAPVGTFGATARAFLETHAFVPSGALVSDPTITYLAPVGNDPIQTTRDKATLVQLDFRLLLDAFPVVGGYPDLPTFTFWFDGAGAIRKFSGIRIPALEKAGATPILSLAQARARLDAGGGAIVSAFSRADRNRVETQYYKFSSTRVTSAALGFSYVPGGEYLVPVFLFSGRATDERTKRLIDTITLVSAVP